MADEGEGGPASKRGTERQGEGRRGTAKDFTSTSCDPHSSTGRGVPHLWTGGTHG